MRSSLCRRHSAIMQLDEMEAVFHLFRFGIKLGEIKEVFQIFEFFGRCMAVRSSISFVSTMLCSDVLRCVRKVATMYLDSLYFKAFKNRLLEVNVNTKGMSCR